MKHFSYPRNENCNKKIYLESLWGKRHFGKSIFFKSHQKF